MLLTLSKERRSTRADVVRLIRGVCLVGLVSIFLLPSHQLLAQNRNPVSATKDSTSPAILTILSTPSGADVLIDGAMAGRTPVQLNSISAGIHTLVVSKTGFCDFNDSILMMEHLSMTKEVQLDSSCGISIISTPDSAGVYVDNVYVGKSPLRVANLRPGWKSLKLTKQNWAIWEDRVFTAPGNVVAVTAKMRSKFSTLNLEVFSPDVEVTVDGKPVGSGSLVDYMIPSGWHDIGAMKREKSERVNETIYIQPGETAQWQARFAVPSKRAFLYSLLLPGLGQILDRSSVEGFSLLGGFVATCVAGYAMNVTYNDRLGEYNDAIDQYRAARSESAAKIAGDALEEKRQTLNTPYKLRNVAIGVAGALYVYSLAEAFFNHATENQITPVAQNAGTRITPALALTPTESRIAIYVTF